MIAQSGDLGVAGYVVQSYADGAIGYVEYSYALNATSRWPRCSTPPGYYTEPTPENVAVSLLEAQVDTTDVNDPACTSPRTSAASTPTPTPAPTRCRPTRYLILPTKVQGQFTDGQGQHPGRLLLLRHVPGPTGVRLPRATRPCPSTWSRTASTRSPRSPGRSAQNINIQSCNNPTFSPSGANLLAETAPQPPACDKQGPDPVHRRDRRGGQADHCGQRHRAVPVASRCRPPGARRVARRIRPGPAGRGSGAGRLRRRGTNTCGRPVGRRGGPAPAARRIERRELREHRGSCGRSTRRTSRRHRSQAHHPDVRWPSTQGWTIDPDADPARRPGLVALILVPGGLALPTAERRKR